MQAEIKLRACYGYFIIYVLWTAITVKPRKDSFTRKGFNEIQLENNKSEQSNSEHIRWNSIEMIPFSEGIIIGGGGIFCSKTKQLLLAVMLQE